MEGCLLCLEIDKDFLGCIKVDSTQWQELSIKNLIEKHLWIMESILPTSWLCQICWQALYDFHKFYMRIEEAHLDFGKLMKRENEPDTNDLKDLQIFDDKVLFESHLEPEMLIDQLMMEEDKAVVKDEPNEELDEDNEPLIQRPKRKFNSKDILSINETKNQDPLEKPKKSKSSKNKKKKEPSVETNPTKESTENSEIETSPVKHDPDTFEKQNICNFSPNSSDCDDFDFNTDLDYKPEEDDIEKPKPTTKKKPRKQNAIASDNNSGDDIQPKEKVTKQTKKSKKKKKSRKNKSSETEDSEEDDTRHHEQSHKERNQFLAENFKMSCDLCQIPMDTFRNLQKHFEDEHKERGYAVCCSKKYFSRGNLVEHVRYHVDPNSFKCNICGRVLSSRKILQDHQLLHLPEEEKKFTCTECGKSFAQQSVLSYHIRAVHLKNNLKICDICGKSLRSGDGFQRHMLEHEGKSLPSINCDICGLPVGTKYNLWRHKSVHHPVDGKREHICKICSKVSPNICALRKHISDIHKAKNNHKCAICERCFKRPLALREHMATHTGIALYTCPWCPKTFNASGGMHAHRKRQHPVEWEQAQREKIEKYRTMAATRLNNSGFL